MSETAKKRVVFIEPTGNEINVFANHMRLPLTGSLYLGTILHNAGYEVRIYNENILSRKIDPFSIKADVFCITSLTVSANSAKLLTSQIRRVYPHVRIIVGGIHASSVPEDFTDVADHVVCGEAENIIIDLVEGRFKDKIVRGSPVNDVESLPLVNYSLLESFESLDIIPVMTSRGCPFDCTFCTVTKIFGKKFRMQSPERIIEEVKHALGYFRTRTIFFYDDNFTANKERVNKFCDLLLRENIDITWTAQVRSDIARSPELVEKMHKSGCRWFFVGFESINDEILKALHKSQSRIDIENAIKVIHQHGINIHGMFMLGEDNDTLPSIRETADFAVNHNLDTVQFMILTPFPGTQFYEKMVQETRLFHKRWDYFDGMYIVFQPKNMSASQLQKETVQAYRKFYSLRRVSMDALQLIFNVTVDALVWDFRRAFRYSFDSFFVKVGGKFIVNRYGSIYNTYSKFLNDIELQSQQKSK